MTFSRKIYATLKKVGVASLIAIVAGCGQKTDDAGKVAAAQERILKIGYIGPGKTVGGAVGWSIENGTLLDKIKPLGFTGVQEIVFPNGPDLNEALLSHNLDIGVYGDTPALVAQANKGGTRLIGLNSVAVEAWLVTAKGSAAQSLSDLNGKNIGVPKGSYLHRYLNGLIDLGLLKNVEQKFILPRDARSALENGDIAAYVAPIQLGPFLVGEGFKAIDLASQHKLQGNSVIVAREDFLAATPGFFKVFDEVRRTATADLLQKKDAYYAYYVKNTQYSEAVIKESFPLEGNRVETYPEDGVALLEGTKAFLLSKGLINQDFSISDWEFKE